MPSPNSYSWWWGQVCWLPLFAWWWQATVEWGLVAVGNGGWRWAVAAREKGDRKIKWVKSHL